MNASRLMQHAHDTIHFHQQQLSNFTKIFDVQFKSNFQN